LATDNAIKLWAESSEVIETVLGTKNPGSIRVPPWCKVQTIANSNFISIATEIVYINEKIFNMKHCEPKISVPPLGHNAYDNYGQDQDEFYDMDDVWSNDRYYNGHQKYKVPDRRDFFNFSQY
jgi:hypothetical protein